jgi:hypothetical protein
MSESRIHSAAQLVKSWKTPKEVWRTEHSSDVSPYGEALEAVIEDLYDKLELLAEQVVKTEDKVRHLEWDVNRTEGLPTLQMQIKDLKVELAAVKRNLHLDTIVDPT